MHESESAIFRFGYLRHTTVKHTISETASHLLSDQAEEIIQSLRGVASEVVICSLFGSKIYMYGFVPSWSGRGP